MKSKSEQKLERMTEERDHWKRIATQKDNVIVDLQRQLERVGIYSKGFSAGFFEIDNQIGVIQKERDDLRQELDRVYTSIGLHLQQSQKLATEYEALNTGYWQDTKTAQQYDRSVISRAILFSTNQALGLTVNLFNDLYKQRLESLDGEQVSSDIDAVLANMRYISTIAGFHSVSIGLAVEAQNMTQNPYLICSEIMLQLQANDTFSAALLEDLPTDWIEANIDRSPSIGLLHEGLIQSHKCEMSNITIKEFAVNNAVSEITVKRWRSWYKVFKETAYNPPIWMQRLLEAPETKKGIQKVSKIVES